MVEYASFGRRFSGGLIDIVVAWLISIVASVLSVVTGSSSIQYVGQAIVVIGWIYLEATSGQTPGKMILGTKIVNEKNETIGLGRAILRYVGRFVCGLTLGIGYLAIAWSEKKQGLHDKIASTYVIKL